MHIFFHSGSREICSTRTVDHMYCGFIQQHDSGSHNRASVDNKKIEIGQDRDNNIVSMSIGSEG